MSVLANSISPCCNANSSFKKDLIDIFKFNLLKSIEVSLKLIFGLLIFVIVKNQIKKRIDYYLEEKNKKNKSQQP